MNYYSPRQYRQNKEAVRFLVLNSFDLAAKVPGALLVQAKNLVAGDQVFLPNGTRREPLSWTVSQPVQTTRCADGLDYVRVYHGQDNNCFEANDRLCVVRP